MHSVQGAIPCSPRDQVSVVVLVQGCSSVTSDLLPGDPGDLPIGSKPAGHRVQIDQKSKEVHGPSFYLGAFL